MGKFIFLNIKKKKMLLADKKKTERKVFPLWNDKFSWK